MAVVLTGSLSWVRLYNASRYSSVLVLISIFHHLGMPNI
jgi:hypothetical protein